MSHFVISSCDKGEAIAIPILKVVTNEKGEAEEKS
jgi:hypothetical protein